MACRQCKRGGARSPGMCAHEANAQSMRRRRDGTFRRRRSGTSPLMLAMVAIAILVALRFFGVI